MKVVCKDNVRLPCPEKPRAPLGCTKELHDVMLLCWKQDPDDRPSFDDLLTTLLPSAGVV